MSIRIFTTGGTFDKIYFDALSEFRIGEPIVGQLLEEANVSFEYCIRSLLKKDSLEIDDAEREMIRDAVCNVEESKVMITHGTDTMIDTARALLDIPHKTIVLFGSIQPARMRYSDAMYNLGVASAAVQFLPNGVHLAMNGRIFDPGKVIKNRAQSCFELSDH
ncbi:MAG: asparaginase [Gammaproteobacteria bacterium]|nr:asparaginase [Gammaproteobacteria bacterium]